MSHRSRNNIALFQHMLENDKLLDVQEKTSLVFLMCDDAVKACCILTKNIIQCEYNKILPDLVDCLTETDKEIINIKFLESLILIKNYQVVKQLGFDFKMLKAKFKERGSKMYVNRVRKVLLRMCESMSDNELADFIHLIEQDFIEHGCYFSFRKTKLIEITLLKLICEDYISDGTKNKETNVTNLIKHLKKMKKDNLAEELEKLNETQFIINEDSEQNIICPDNDFLDKNLLPNVAQKRVVASDTNSYKMDENNMGLCVVINQRNFSEKKCVENGVNQLSTRTGTDCDRDMLKIAFTALGFQFILHENLDSVNLRRCIINIVQQEVQKEHSSFVLCLLSHGKRDTVYCTDGIGINVEEIERMISGEHCPQLLGKPKIIFIQACQGSDFQKAVPVSHNIRDDDDDNDGDCNMPDVDGPSNLIRLPKLPPTADILTFWATVPGYASLRNCYSGSVFIQTLCACLLKHGHFPNDLQDIVRIVNDQLSQTQFGDECHVSMPQVKHTITKKLYFPYSPQNRFKAAQMLYLKYLVEELLKVCVFETGVLQYFVKNKLKKKQYCSK